MIKGQIDTSIVCGDTYHKRIYLSNIEIATIEGVYVSCELLDISQKTTWDSENGCFVFTLDSETTATYDKILTNYDITLKLNSGEIKTLVYQARLRVLPKNNEVNYE